MKLRILRKPDQRPATEERPKLPYTTPSLRPLPDKLPYRPPTLHEYGSVVTVTDTFFGTFSP